MASLVWLPDGNVPAVQNVVRQMREDGAEPHPLWAEFRVYTYWGASTVVAMEKGRPVALTSTKFGKRPQKGFGPYANLYGTYTLASHRGRGLGKLLLEETMEEAVRRGCQRIKTHAASRSGLQLFTSEGLPVWGVTDKREAIIDGFLAHFSDTRPPPGFTKPLGPAAIKKLLKEGLRYDQAKT